MGSLKSNLQKFTENKKKMSQQAVWSIVRQNHAYLVKSRKSGGVQFSKHPGNLKNKNTSKYSALANDKAVTIQGLKEGGISLRCGNAKAEWKSSKGRRPTLVRASNSVGKLTPSLKAVSRKRISAILRSQKNN